MFIDEVEIYVKAGNGGNGAVSFRREKFVPKGGPDGGDGGKGGDIIVEVDNRAHALSEFTRKKRFLAENGESGMGAKKSGKNAPDLIMKVPAGTEIIQKDIVLYDLTKEGDRVVLAKGGKGGWGNQHFASSIKQAPAWSKDGMRGESMKVQLVLKTIADVGLVGLPNAGKSTLLSALTSAKPKIADYQFTTLEPNLGTYIDKDSRIIFADIPGLIEGASLGRGLGDKFLRHIERTKTIVHLIDATSDQVLDDYKAIRKELKEYSKDLAKKNEIVVLNKIEMLTEEELKEKLDILSTRDIRLSATNKPLTISASSHKGLDLLIQKIKELLSKSN